MVELEDSVMTLVDFLTRDQRAQREKDRQLDSLKVRYHVQVLHIADLNAEVALLAMKGESALREAGVVPAHVRPSRYEGFVVAAIPETSPAPRASIWAYIARWEDINLTSTKRGIVRYQAAIVRNSSIIKSLGEDIEKRQWELKRLAAFEADWERRRLDWQRKAFAARLPPRPVLPLSPSLCLPRPAVGQRHRVRFVGDVVDDADSSVIVDTLAVDRNVVATATAATVVVDTIVDNPATPTADADVDDITEQVVVTADPTTANNAPVIVRKAMPPVIEADIEALEEELSLLTVDDPVERLEREIGPTILRLQMQIRGAVLRSKIRWARNQLDTIQLRNLQVRAKGALSRALVVPRLVKERLAEQREEARRNYRRQQAEVRQELERQQAEERQRAEARQAIERQQAARKQAEFKCDFTYIPPTPQRPQTETTVASAQQSVGSIFNLQSLNIVSGGQFQTATRTPEEPLADANSTTEDAPVAGVSQGVSTETAAEGGVVDKGKGKATNDGPGVAVTGATGPKGRAGNVLPISTRQMVKNGRSLAKIGDIRPITRGRTSAAFGGHWGADISGMPGSSKIAKFDFSKMAKDCELDANLGQTAEYQTAKEEGVDEAAAFDLAQMNKDSGEYADILIEAAEQVALVVAEEASPKESHEAEESEVSEEE